MGPGFLRNDAELKGFSIATEDECWFYPLSYPEDNYHDPGAALAWLKDVCATDTDKVFHNAMYDIESLGSEGITVQGRWHDTMVYEALLEEKNSVSLDATAHRHLGTTKDETLLVEGAAAYGLNPKSEMFLLPARFVGPYGEKDAAILPGILAKQKELFGTLGLERVQSLESDLLKTTWAMREHGVPVDVEGAHALDIEWKAIYIEQLAAISKQIPFDIDIWSTKSLVRLCEHIKVDYNRTPKGNPSFENAWFEAHPHPVMQLLATARQYDKMRRDFLGGQIFKYEVNGRIHGQFHTTRRDDGGTRSGRFASSNPNLQQVPARHPIFGGAIRSLFQPDEGGLWGKFDYSSQEPRITLHLANIAGIRGAAEFVERYRHDPTFCQHSFAAGVLGLERKACKGINLGLTYGMGINKLANELGMSENDAAIHRKEYKAAMPFVGAIADHYTQLAETYGYTQTILGRRSWFTGDDSAYCYKALNRAVQGSGADLMKTAIVEVHKELGMVPLCTVHDETNYTIYEEEHCELVREIMEECIQMTVPQHVDPELGENWGSL